MKNKGFLLFTVGLFTMFGVYIFWSDIVSIKYSKSFKEEMLTYVIDLNEWSKKEDEIIKDYNKNVIEKAEDNAVAAYDYLENNIIERMKILIKDVELREIKEKETEEIKKEYIGNLGKRLELYEKYLTAFEEQDEKEFEKAKVLYAQQAQERKIYNQKISNLIEEMKIDFQKEE